jgi:RNA polymerase sigma factor (sigma-70 family)
MNERTSDFEWLQQFARKGDQSAFRDLVRRHLDLVYATALRKTGDAGGAEEIAQNVFAALARKAWTFAPDDSLPAWLYKTALLESKQWIRGEFRRRRRESAAAELGTTMKTTDEKPAFSALVPLLDEALLSLREKDRAALLLRFYEKQSLRDVGASLGVSEDTAQKRVATALERLSEFFQRRGFRTASVAAAGAALQHTSATASAATFTLVAGAALDSAPPALAGLGAWLARLATLSKAQTALLCAAVSAAPVAWQVHAQRAARGRLAATEAQLSDVAQQVGAAQEQSDRLRSGNRQLASSVADRAAAAARSLEAGHQFEDWKTRVRGELTASDYRWPADSPFVRIPKSVLPDLDTHKMVVENHGINEGYGWSSRVMFSPPGDVAVEARELLGLTPEERARMEAALNLYISSSDASMGASVYETNQARHLDIPADAVASDVWVIPAATNATERAEQFKATLRSVVGEDRWPLMSGMLRNGGLGMVQNLNPYNLGIDQNTTEVAVWVNQEQSQVTTRTWSGGWDNPPGMGTQGVGVGSLSSLLPDSIWAKTGGLAGLLGVQSLPEEVSRKIVRWAQDQATQRLGKEK